MIDNRRALWDGEAATFDEAADHGLNDPSTRAAWLRLLEAALGEPALVVADLGCGTGTLTALLSQAGHEVRGVDFSAEMLRVARTKVTALGLSTTFIEADVADPPLQPSSVDAVLSRHVLWAMPDPDAALAMWVRLLQPTGRLVLIVGRWSTGAGLTAQECSTLVLRHRHEVVVTPLDDPVLWGGPVSDERYLLVSRR